jgi:hypothetical protein
MKRGDVVWPCYDAKMGRGVPGIVIKTKQTNGVLVRFRIYAGDDDEIVEAWFKRRANTHDVEWSKLGKNPIRLFGPRHKYSAWVKEDDMMQLFIGGNRGSYYLLRTEKQMRKHGSKLPISNEGIAKVLADLRA